MILSDGVMPLCTASPPPSSSHGTRSTSFRRWATNTTPILTAPSRTRPGRVASVRAISGRASVHFNLGSLCEKKSYDVISDTQIMMGTRACQSGRSLSDIECVSMFEMTLPVATHLWRCNRAVYLFPIDTNCFPCPIIYSTA
jgi:hypothetical protein